MRRRKHIEIELDEVDNKNVEVMTTKKVKKEKETKIDEVDTKNVKVIATKKVKKEKETKFEEKGKKGKTIKKVVKNEVNSLKKNDTKTVKEKDKPKFWLQTFNEIKEYREKNEAPVDTQGCERLANENLPPKQYRYQVLISLMLSSQTKDQITAEAIRKLQKKGLTIENILKMSEKEIDQCIEKVGFHNRKTM